MSEARTTEILETCFDSVSSTLKTTATINTGDIEIGAVEIKNATDDTRATVGANGLYVDIRNVQAGTSIIGKVGIDQTTDGTTNRVTSAGDTVEVSHTRPANTTAYTANDVVGTDPATNLEFTNVLPVAGNCIITGAYMRIRVASLPSGMSTFKLHLYSSAPTAITDNSAFNVIDADRSKYLGYITFNQPEDVGDNILWTQIENINMVRKLSSTSIFGVLQTVGAFTPTSACVKDIGICVLGR